MKTKLKALLLCLCVYSLSAQTYDFKGIRRINLHDINAIIENNEVKGYFAFYFLEKAGKKQNLYNLEILDNNLKQAYSVELKMSDRLTLLESSYNSERFCFSFVDLREKVLEYLILDKTGKTVGTYSLEISKSELAIYQSALVNEEDSYNGGLQAIKGKGFVRMGYEKEDGLRIDLEMIDNSGKKKWELSSGVDSKKSFEAVNPYYADDKVMIAGLSTRESRFSTRNTKYSVMFINVESGKEYFRWENKNDKYQLSPLGATYNGEGQTYLLYGQYYKPDDNLAKDDPTGFYVQEIDLSGKLVMESYTEWEGTIYPEIVRKNKGKMEKNMKTFIHKIVKTADGKMFAIGEQYRKAASGAGIAMKVLMGNNANVSVVKVEIHNMLVFEFDNKMKFKDVTIFEKETSDIMLPEGWGMIDANILGYMMKLYGRFDYEYTSVSSDRKVFNCAYLDYDPGKGSNLTAGNISYTKEQKLAIDKIKLSSKPTSVGIFEAKPGYMAIFEYYRKEKRALIRLEKLNF